MLQDLVSKLEEQGVRGRIVSLQHLTDLQEEIAGRYGKGLLDPELYRTYLSGFTFSPPDGLPQARSILIVAVPQPRVRVTFTWEGEPARFVIPPTYAEREVDQRVRDLLEQVLEPAGYRVAPARLPKKLLAVRSGLAAYGRNNISYIPGLGSFYGLVALFSDLPAPNDSWQEPQMMERCQNCSACLRHCPVGAITSERFLLHAERCITFHNEKPGDVSFPGNLDPSWHNCLVGCLHCQRVCPANREVWPWVHDGAQFSPEETGWLLEGVPLQRLPAATVQKLERLGLDAYLDVLPRNLKALLRQRVA